MLRKMDYKYFSKAKQVASVSDYSHIHVGCVAVYQGNIIGIGCNTNKTHPSQQYYNRFRNGGVDPDYSFIPKMHAEINCINSLKNMGVNFSKVRLYIFRERYDQDYGLARPCPSCMAAIRDLGIRHVYYTTNDGFAYEEIKLQKGCVA